MEFKTFFVSKAGGRKDNQDYCKYARKDKFWCWVVADGLGGHKNGEIASKLAVDSVIESFLTHPGLSDQLLRQYVVNAQQKLLNHINICRSEIYTTIAVLISDGNEALWMHIGDTRLYHFREERIIFQTKDHSVSQAAVQIGEITKDQIRFHEDRNRLLKVLGIEGVITLAISNQVKSITSGDVFLLCSDGFWEYVYEDEMEKDLKESKEPELWITKMEVRLIKRAKEGNDNYTALAVYVI